MRPRCRPRRWLIWSLMLPGCSRSTLNTRNSRAGMPSPSWPPPASCRPDGVPVGRHIGYDEIPSAGVNVAAGGSIIVIVATDAPLLPVQCHRLAKRAAVGLGRVGGHGHNGSGDIFLAFATGNHISARPAGNHALEMVPSEHMDPLFHGVTEATEEAILNALCAAESTTGRDGRRATAIPLDRVRELVLGSSS